MTIEKTMGQEIIDAVNEALTTPSTGSLRRSAINVKELRTKLNLTQKEFSTQYHINLETLKNWEQEKRIPDLTSVAFLTCIAKSPDTIYNLLNS
jgi:putative transcriptional regulator